MVASLASATPDPGTTTTGELVQVHSVRYTAHDGRPHRAYVAVPARYVSGIDPPLPLVIALHGRGTDPDTMLERFGDLPAIGSFALVSPQGQGRRLRRFSWGYSGQIHDLATLPRQLATAVPWLELDLRRVYAFGTSMGGQEALLLAALKPGLLAGVAAFDATTDFALQYWNFGKLVCRFHCGPMSGARLGAELRRLARVEVGGAPTTVAARFAARSPLHYARKLAVVAVPLQLWWSANDSVVREPQRQSGALFDRLSELNPSMPMEGFVGRWSHATMMNPAIGVPIALARFGLLPTSYNRVPANIEIRGPAPLSR